MMAKRKCKTYRIETDILVDFFDKGENDKYCDEYSSEDDTWNNISVCMQYLSNLTHYVKHKYYSVV